MKVAVNVTTEDISTGEKGILSCPLAKAISRAVGKNCWVGHEEWGSVGFGIRGWLPDGAGQFVKDFDNGREVWPVEFELEI